jgi:hypothetical protein
MERKYKINDAHLKKYKRGSKLKTSEIIECVTRYYPEIPIGSIMKLQCQIS